LAHRGIWTNKNEQNTLEAFQQSFELGLGIETDIRDLDGELVVSHDMPTKLASVPKVVELFDLYSKFNIQNMTLALNIKSDGLCQQLQNYLREFNIKHYFTFDMSMPDTLSYSRNGVNYFTRQSEYEITPPLYDKAIGVWLDEFEQHWINKQVIEQHIGNGKQVCIVSPELHGRSYEREWSDYKIISTALNEDVLSICTDLVEQAQDYFNG